MIFQFKETDNVNQLFHKLYKHPSLLWKAIAALTFFLFAMAILFIPSLTNGFTDGSRTSFGLLMTFYSLFRGYTFYSEYKSYANAD
jgi:prolipoprotein diacylglyceryltransferase